MWECDMCDMGWGPRDVIQYRGALALLQALSRHDLWEASGYEAAAVYFCHLRIILNFCVCEASYNFILN